MKFLSKVVKNDPKDRLEIELGDTKEPSVFFPQLKIKRWDNEVNASFRLKDFDNFSISSDKGKIKLVNGKKEVHLYPIEPCEEHPEDGFEFEVILKEKPASNVLEFSIETKGLDFFYQPALNQKEIDEGANRPESVVGSYAVYHKTKGGLNIVGGKEYKVGKAFHIFRPKIIDSAGNWVWGKLHIDVENKLQIITIPQEFLDGAVYPIRHAAGETFGYTTDGSSGQSIAGQLNDQSSRRGTTHTMPEAGTLGSIHAYLVSESGSGDQTLDVRAIVNEEDSEGSGSHGEIAGVEILDLATTEVSALFEFTASSESLSDGAEYILNVCGDGFDVAGNFNDVRVKYDTTGSQNYYGETVLGGYATLSVEDPWTLAVAGTGRKYSIYATYTPAGAGARRYYSPGIWRTV